MGIATKLNKKIKHALIIPFWNLFSPETEDRLYMHLIEKINDIIFSSRGNIQSIPDNYVICINQKSYRKIERKREVLRCYLKKMIEEYLSFLGFQINNKDVTIDFSPLSYLKNREVKIFCFSSEKDNSNTAINRKGYYVRLHNSRDKKWFIGEPGEYIIGRGNEAFIRIENWYVSGCHAKLILSLYGDVKISDCGSRNGTYVNDYTNPVVDCVSVAPGDKIYLGKRRKITLELMNR